MKEEAKRQEADNNATFTGNWAEVVYTLTAETRFAETSIPICHFLIFLLVFLQRICFSGWLLASMQYPNMFGQNIVKTGNANSWIIGRLYHGEIPSVGSSVHLRHSPCKCVY